MSTIVAAICAAREQGASDVHLKPGLPPMLRKAGILTPAEFPAITGEDVLHFLQENTGVDIQALRSGCQAADFSFSIGDIRLRGNAYKDNTGICAAFRLLTLVDANWQELGIPEVLKTLSQRNSGLILITGPTGSGKTTTLTYLLEYINQTQKKHIITLEDPIEFIHFSQNSIFSQREIGRDTLSYDRALTEALREDPDIIMVGEMRDRDSIEAALRAAETGHLVLSTLHTKGAANSITRIIDVFPESQQNQIRTQLSMTLLCVVSQQLCPGTQPGTRHLATEVMVATHPIRAMIKQDKVHQLSSTIQTSRADGMHTMQHALETLLRAGKITKETHDNYQIL